METRTIWGFIREAFPPARLVAFVTPFIIPLIAAFNGWLVDHLPFIAEHLDQTEVTAFVLAQVATGAALAYKWLDGRAKWETTQVQAQIALVQADKSPQDLPPGVLEPPPAPADTDVDAAGPYPLHEGVGDDDALLSDPTDDIAESDADDPDAPERRERLPETE